MRENESTNVVRLDRFTNHDRDNTFRASSVVFLPLVDGLPPTRDGDDTFDPNALEELLPGFIPAAAAAELAAGQLSISSPYSAVST